MARNEAQTRALAITLGLLDERCAQVMALLDPPGAGSAGHVVSDIPPATADSARAHIAGLRAEIAVLSAELELQSAPRSALQTARALVMSSRCLLEEVLPERLGRDSTVAPNLDGALTKALAPMIERLDVLGRLLARPLE